MTLAVVDSGLDGAVWNVAMTAAFCELHGEGRLPDTLRLYRYRKSVLLGRNQTAEAAADLAACAEAGAEVVYRVTGGGAVYMQPEILAWDLILDRRRLPDLEAASALVSGALAETLSALGCDASFRAPGDVIVKGRKVSGSSGYYETRSLIHQGTVLIEADLEEMARLLRFDAGALAGAVTTLAQELTEPPGASLVAERFTARLAGALGVETLPFQDLPAVEARARGLLARDDEEPPFAQAVTRETLRAEIRA